jgi:co-chaperonin GroES (HSP10)
MKLKPQLSRILVRELLPQDQVTAGGLFLPGGAGQADSNNPHNWQAEVVAVGHVSDRMKVSDGDIVLVDPSVPVMPFSMPGDTTYKYFFVNEPQVLAVVTDGTLVPPTIMDPTTMGSSTNKPTAGGGLLGNLTQ